MKPENQTMKIITNNMLFVQNEWSAKLELHHYKNLNKTPNENLNNNAPAFYLQMKHKYCWKITPRARS